MLQLRSLVPKSQNANQIKLSNNNKFLYITLLFCLFHIQISSTGTHNWKSCWEEKQIHCDFGCNITRGSCILLKY